MKTVSSVVLIVWYLLVIQAAMVTNMLESTPDSINGQLLACVGDRISLICARDFELSTGMTYWTISSSTIPCESLINHLPPVSLGDCDSFMFQNVTEVAGPVTTLSSSAVATANTSMSGAVIMCSTSRIPQLSMPIGPNITLCIPDQLSPPENVQVDLRANGTVQIVWDRPPHVCTARNISYDINLIPTDGSIIDNGTELPVTTTERSIILYLTPGREYSAVLTANNTDCSISSDTVTKNFTAMQNAVTTVESPTASSTMDKATAQTTQTSTALSQSTITIIIIVVVILVIICVVLIIVAVAIWYFFFWRPKVLLKHTNTTDATVELHVKSSEVDALVYDDPSPKAVAHVEAVSGDLYAQPDKMDKKSADSRGVYQDPNSIKHKQAPTGDEYAMPQQTRKKKSNNQGSSVDPVNANVPALYSTVDKSTKNQLTYAQLEIGSGSGAQPVPQSTSYATIS